MQQENARGAMSFGILFLSVWNLFLFGNLVNFRELSNPVENKALRKAISGSERGRSSVEGQVK